MGAQKKSQPGLLSVWSSKHVVKTMWFLPPMTGFLVYFYPRFLEWFSDWGMVNMALVYPHDSSSRRAHLMVTSYCSDRVFSPGRMSWKMWTERRKRTIAPRLHWTVCCLSYIEKWWNSCFILWLCVYIIYIIYIYIYGLYGSYMF